MATYHQKKKLWEARRRITLPNGIKSRQSFWAPTEEEAEQAAEALIQSLRPPEPANSFEKYATFTYAPTIKLKSENWRSQVVWACKHWLFPRWGRTSIESINRAAVQQWFSDLEAGIAKGDVKLSAWSVQHIRKVFRAIMELAVFDGMIVRNPVYRISIQAPKHEPTVWTPRQLARLVACSKGTVWQPVWFLCGYAGLRCGEAIGLGLDMVSPDDLKVERQALKERLGPKNYRIRLSETLKTPGSHRRIALPEGFYARVLSMGASGHYACPNKLGGILDPENASRGLAIAIARANASITAEDDETGLKPLPRGTSHDLRHTCAAILDDLACPGIARRLILGHAGKDAHEKYGKAFDQTIRGHLGTMLSVLEAEERLLALRPQPGVKDFQAVAEKSNN